VSWCWSPSGGHRAYLFLLNEPVVVIRRIITAHHFRAAATNQHT
jgi:hypothetical protein